MVEFLVNTEMLKDMVDHGLKPFLPPVEVSDEMHQYYPDAKSTSIEDNAVYNVVEDGEEEVQCISIDDEDHLYLTDGLTPTHNTSNIIFLKSTDDSMLDTLQKMSGTRHVAYKDSKTITRDLGKVVQSASAVEGKIGFTVHVVEEPTIKYNDMAFIGERNSIVFRAGDPPIWNRNEMILPMSWKLFDTTIVHAGHEYSLQTIPTLSSAMDFDVRKNQPDFRVMLDKRMSQATYAKQATESYQKAYQYSDYEMTQLDPDNLADDLMQIINSMIRKEANKDSEEDEFADFDYESVMSFYDDAEDNTEVATAVAEKEAEIAQMQVKKFAGGMLSPYDLISGSGAVKHNFDKEFVSIFNDIRGDFEQDREYFVVENGNLYSADGIPYIIKTNESDTLRYMNQASGDTRARVFAEDDITEEELNQLGSYTVTDSFYQFLAGLESWSFAKRRFEAMMEQVMKEG